MTREVDGGNRALAMASAPLRRRMVGLQWGKRGESRCSGGKKERRSSGYTYIERGKECGGSKLGVHAGNGGCDSRH